MELWQLYDEQGCAIAGKGAAKEQIRHGLLHGVSHVWIWRRRGNNIEVLLQKRADDKPTWPSLYDISAAGHIDLGEDPLDSALREASEEIGLKINPQELRFVGIYRCIMHASSDIIENEFQWLYLLELKSDTKFNLQTSEVSQLDWISLGQLEIDWFNKTRIEAYVPHGDVYYQTIIEAIKQAAEQ